MSAILKKLHVASLPARLLKEFEFHGRKLSCIGED